MPEDVSLVVATYRRHSKIAPALQSALDQTVPFAEIVVVDDCSPDRSAEWICTHFPTVRVISTPRNMMTSGARNLGAADTTSPWLMFLDHDDLLRPYAHQALLDLARACPEAGALHADHSYENRATGEHFADHRVSIPAFKRLADLPVVRRSPEGRLSTFQGPKDAHRSDFAERRIFMARAYGIVAVVTKARSYTEALNEGSVLHRSTRGARARFKLVPNALAEGVRPADWPGARACC